MDVVVVTHGPDLGMLRHLLDSYQLFFQDKGELLIFCPGRDEKALLELRLPPNTRVIRREVATRAAPGDSFGEQMFTKLVAHQFVASEEFVLVDSDFLFIDHVCDRDYLPRGKPVWFFTDWVDGAPPQKWRRASEQFAGASIDQLYMTVPQWVMSSAVCSDMARRYDLEALLSNQDCSEFLLYGWFAHSHWSSTYDFVHVDPYGLNGAVRPLVAKVNQIPPDYCRLDASVTLDDYAGYKCVVFWSHWDLAEAKSVEFLRSSQQRAFGEIAMPPQTTPLFATVATDAIARGEYRALAGVFADGWVSDRVMAAVDPPSNATSIVLTFDVPEHPSDPAWKLDGSAAWSGESNEPPRFALPPGQHRLNLPLPTQSVPSRPRLAMAFGPGFLYPDNQDRREFRARLLGLEFAADADGAPSELLGSQ